LVPVIRELDNADKYLTISRAILTATNIDEVRQVCAEAAAPRSRRKKKGRGKGDQPG
jgi:hypothetical protein